MKSFTLTATKPNCIQLHRFVRLGDKVDSQVFTFIAPSQLTRGFINSAQSKEFTYGGQSWQLQLSLQSEDAVEAAEDGFVGDAAAAPSPATSQKPPLSIGLTFCGGLSGMICQLGLIRYTVLNRNFVHRNKTHEERNVAFTAEEPTRRKTGWLRTECLAREHFIFDDWTWLLEVELQGATTLYEEFLTLPKSGLKGSPGIDGLRLDSASFSYAGSDWSVILNWPNADQKKHTISSLVRLGNAEPGKGCLPRMKLQRHSKTNHWCRVRYKATLAWGNLGECTLGPVDHLITADNGATTTGCEIGDVKWFTATSMLPPKQRVKVIIEMFAAAPVSRIDLVPIAPQGGKNYSLCKDTDGQDWIVLSDILGSLVRLKFFPVVEVHRHDGVGGGLGNDGAGFPDRPCELRCVAWNVHLIPHESSCGVVKALHSPYVSYVPTFRYHLNRDGGSGSSQPSVDFSNDNQQMMIHPDEVTEVALDLPVEKVIEKSSGYIRPNDNAMTIRIEWLPSQRLYHSNYNVYDDIFQTHKKQLARELRALQLENYTLEKQLYMGNPPSSVEINVPEHEGSVTSSQLRQPLGMASNPRESKSSVNPTRHSFSQVSVSRRLPDASQRSSPTQGSFLSANTINSVNIRRHSSSYTSAIEAQERPRRSLPSPGAVGGSSWRSQPRCGLDDEYSEGYDSREDSPKLNYLQVGSNGGCSGPGLTVRSNMSSPIRHHNRATYLRPFTAGGTGGGGSTNSPAHQRYRHHRSVTPTLVFSLSSEDSISGVRGGGGGGNE